MTASSLPHALYGLFIIGVFLAWFYVVWQDFVIESGRGALQELRDEWFDLVISSSTWRGDAACRAFMSILEAQVQWVHNYSVPMVVLVFCLPGARRRRASTFIEATVRELPSVELRWKARRLLDDAAVAIGRAMILRSLPALVFVLLLLPLALIGGLVGFFISRLLANTVTVPAALLRQGWVGGLRDAASRTLRPVFEMEVNSSVGGSVAAVWRGERRRST